jgi:NAD(P)H dehydrogenase (quinone)
MNILVVLANPKERCFTREVCAIYCEEAARLGHEVVLRDLYALRFNPIASAADLTGNVRGEVAPDVAAEQAHVTRADVITFIHPIWWIDRPAILKGWVDRVFALGFAYGYGADGTRGSLAGKQAVLLTSSGSTQDEFDRSGKMAAISVAQVLGTLEFCDLSVLGHLHFAPVGRRSPPEMVEGYKQQVRDFVRTKLALKASAAARPVSV